MAGHLLVYECDNRDFGLISVRPDVPVKPVSVATTTHHPQPGDPIFSVGCDHGADPSVRVSTISAIDRYVGPPTVEIHGHPVEGRSGGGLFTADGQIIGICNSADLQRTAASTLHCPPSTWHSTASTNAAFICANQDESPGLLADATPSAAGMTAVATVPTPASPSNAEVICVVRAPDGTSRVLVVKNPSPTLLAQMSTESQQQTLPSPSFSPTSPTHEIAQTLASPLSAHACRACPKPLTHINHGQSHSLQERPLDGHSTATLPPLYVGGCWATFISSSADITLPRELPNRGLRTQPRSGRMSGRQIITTVSQTEQRSGPTSRPLGAAIY